MEPNRKLTDSARRRQVLTALSNPDPGVRALALHVIATSGLRLVDPQAVPPWLDPQLVPLELRVLFAASVAGFLGYGLVVLL